MIFSFFGFGKQTDPYIFSQPSEEVKKRNVRIGFIDDKKFDIIETLRQEGWLRVDYIEDISSLSEPFIKDHDILFVDIQGVGQKLQFEKEGFGLIEAIRERYPEKVLIAYSAESESKLDTFEEAFNQSNFRLRKTAEPYEFIRILHKSANIVYSHDYQLQRSARIISEKTGRNVSTKEMQEVLTSANSSKGLDHSKILDHFSLEKAANLADIIGLFT